MSTRVQKGSTVFRPVAKARSRPAENSSASILQDTLQPLLETHKTALPSTPQCLSAVIVSDPSTIHPQVSFQGHVDYAAPVAIANTTKHGVPTIISSSPLAQPVRSGPPPIVDEISTPAGPSHTEVLIDEQVPQHHGKRRLHSKSRASTSPPKSRKVRRPATPVFDTDADPGEDLDPTSVTMAALCEDTGQGRISSKAAQVLDNHLAWKKSNKDKRARMRMRMEAKKYGRSEDNDAAQVSRPEGEPEQTSTTDATPGPSSVEPVSGNLATVRDSSEQGFDYSQSVATSRYNVQVRIGPSGETIIDEESLFVDRNAEEDTAEYTHVEESDVTKFVNSATYSRRFRGSRWSAQETELFYDALSQFGENYELISYVLPGRDRKACKNKFKSEDKKNSQRINYSLKNRKPYDIQTLSRITGKDFSGPTPEIRAPVILSLEESRSNPEGDQRLAPEQTVDSSSATTEHVEEVVGDISSFDPE